MEVRTACLGFVTRSATLVGFANSFRVGGSQTRFDDSQTSHGKFGFKNGRGKQKKYVKNDTPTTSFFFFGFVLAHSFANQEAFRIFFMSCTSKSHLLTYPNARGGGAATSPADPSSFFVHFRFFTPIYANSLCRGTVSRSLSIPVALSVYYISLFPIYPNAAAPSP